MKNKGKTLSILTLVLAVVIIALIVNDKNQTENKALPPSQEQSIGIKNQIQTPTALSETESNQIAKSGSVDQIANAIEADFAQDLSEAQDGDADISALTQDIDLININNIYDANEF